MKKGDIMLTLEKMKEFVNSYATRLKEMQPLLNELDNRIGDGDHGTNMARGFQTAVDKLVSSPQTDLETLCNTVAMALLSSVGGASGPLYATVFMRLSVAWKGQTVVDLATLQVALTMALEGLQSRGKASVGDKTMIDVWMPVVNTLRQDISVNGLRRCVKTASECAKASKDLVAKKGRAAYLGERSIGTPDPGAVSSTIFFEELVAVCLGEVERTQWEVLI